MGIGIDLNLLKNNLNKLEKKVEKKKIIDIDIQKFDFSDDKEINNYLLSKSKEIINLIGNSNIFLGQLFIEVQDYLTEHSENNTTYCKWLEFNGFNRMSALRYKKRAIIFNKLTKQKAKEVIALAPQKYIDEISKNELLLDEIQDITNIQDLEQKINNNLLENKETEKEISKTQKQSKIIYDNLIAEIKNNNIKKAKEEVKTLKSLIQDLEQKILEKEEETELKNNLTLNI